MFPICVPRLKGRHSASMTLLFWIPQSEGPKSFYYPKEHAQTGNRDLNSRDSGRVHTPLLPNCNVTGNCWRQVPTVWWRDGNVGRVEGLGILKSVCHDAAVGWEPGDAGKEFNLLHVWVGQWSGRVRVVRSEGKTASGCQVHVR